MTLFAAIGCLALMTSADAVATLLNGQSSCGAKVYSAAKAMVESEAAAGKPLQQFVIGVTTGDEALARRYLDSSRDTIRALAERKDNPMAWYLLSVEKNDFKLLKKAADGGNVQALNALGSIATEEAFSRKSSSKEELERILKKSYDYFRRAASKRDANAFVNLGTCYLRGFGCRQDLELAFRCFAAAAELGHPEGMDNMSAAYQFGHGVKADNDKCLYWAMRGRALRGDEAAAKWLRTRK